MNAVSVEDLAGGKMTSQGFAYFTFTKALRFPDKSFSPSGDRSSGLNFGNVQAPKYAKEQIQQDFMKLISLRPIIPVRVMRTRCGSLFTAALIAIAFGASTSLAAVGTISGPFTHRNLQLFLVHGDTQLEQRHYATLSEGLAKGIVIVKETGNVQELMVENVSKDQTVFINAGDIVKGRRQDRTLRDDLILTARSGLVPLPSFCVEHGRWTRRGEEPAAAFSAN